MIYVLYVYTAHTVVALFAVALSEKHKWYHILAYMKFSCNRKSALTFCLCVASIVLLFCPYLKRLCVLHACDIFFLTENLSKPSIFHSSELNRSLNMNYMLAQKAFISMKNKVNYIKYLWNDDIQTVAFMVKFKLHSRNSSFKALKVKT